MENKQEKQPCVHFYHDDILLPTFLRRYLDKAKKVTGYENQVLYIEQVLQDIENLKPFFHSIPKTTHNEKEN